MCRDENQLFNLIQEFVVSWWEVSHEGGEEHQADYFVAFFQTKKTVSKLLSDGEVVLCVCKEVLSSNKKCYLFTIPWPKAYPSNLILIRRILSFLSILNVIVPCGFKLSKSSPEGVKSTILIFCSFLEKKQLIFYLK